MTEPSPQNRLQSPTDRLSGMNTYIEGKMKRYSLMFSVNGGAFLIAKLFAEQNTALVQISSVEIFRICEFCRLAQAARTADQIAGAVADRLANFPILN